MTLIFAATCCFASAFLGTYGAIMFAADQHLRRKLHAVQVARLINQ